jgi:type IV secretory pathway TrbL component
LVVREEALVKHFILQLTGVALAVLPFACVAVSGGRTIVSDGTGGEESGTVTDAKGGAAGIVNQATGGANAGQAPDLAATYGVEHASSYPCTSNTAAYYDELPITGTEAGCKDIYNSNQLYPSGTTRTIVAPTAPAGASCVSWDCWCSEVTQRWEPSNSNFCQ